ncbi:TonB-dependent siderophore receptor [Ideonella sp. A 288]|uniref:TonB-dependent receptor n=1 Tax=Ideonella sp. A 288 TaxID=1962181 RepID=UPI000B4BB4C3|nr:TonB-dependent receptor [Ideonella sp. A 288]
MRTHPTPVALAMLALVHVPFSALAQSGTVASAASQTVLVTGTAPGQLDARPSSTSRLGISLRETPATVHVVDRAQIDATGALDTQQILESIPGVSFSAQPGAPGSVFYRGFGSASLGQLHNGISVQYDAIAARPVDSWIVDRVEAIGGPSSFLNGSGAVGGSINVITKIADASGDLTHARLGLGDQKQLALSAQRGVGSGHVLRLDLNTTRGAVWTQGDDRKTWQAAASWLAPLAAGLTHTLSLEKQHERVDQPYWGTPLLRDAANAVLNPVQIDPRTVGVNYNVVDGRYQQDVTWARSILNWQLAPATRLTHTLYHYDALRDYENVEVYTFVANNAQVERSSALLQRHDQQVWGSRGELSHGTQLANLRSDFAVGWDWSYNRQTRFPLSVNGPFGRTDPYAPSDTFFYQTPGVVPGHVPGATNLLHTLALFAENRTVLGSGFSLISGVRADRIDLEVRNHRAVTATNPAQFNTRFTPTTGRLGLVKELSPAWQVYAQFSTAADPPSGVLATAGFAALRDFDLTRGRQVELGTKGSFDNGRGDATLALYDITRKNLSMTDPADRSRVIPIGQQSSRGIELSGRWRPSAQWQFSGHASYTEAQFDQFVETVGTQTVSRAGNTPANTPAWVAGATATWQPLPALSLAMDLRHVGRRYANTANTLYDSGYRLIGLGASWQVNDQLSLRARVNNLTDETYAATVGNNLVYLGAPRSVSVSADWKY